MARILLPHMEKAARFCAMIFSCVLTGLAIVSVINMRPIGDLTTVMASSAFIALTIAWVASMGHKQFVKRGLIECAAGSVVGSLCLVVLFPDFAAAHDIRTWLQCIVLTIGFLGAGYFTILCVLSGSAHAVYRFGF